MAKEIIIDEVKELKENKKATNKKLTKKEDVAKEEEIIIEKVEEKKVETPKGTIDKLLANEIIVQKEEPKVKPQPMVRILLNQDHKCNIGGNWYCFKKDKHYNVPENVKTILMRAGKLSPL